MSKKAEARIARALAKKLKEKEKTVRLAEAPPDHEVRSEYAKAAPKEVRAGVDPNSVYGMGMCWTVEKADKDGHWTWGVARDWGDQTWNDDLEPKLKEFEKLTWGEIAEQRYGNPGKRRQMHHSMEVDVICDEAQLRLAALQEQAETLYRFRLGNLPRLWGIRVVEKFHVLWYDPTHQIYPVD